MQTDLAALTEVMLVWVTCTGTGFHSGAVLL
jgi:hypothetical protein